ncbi:tyrosine-type recombinase/integrase [Streptantibioticus rubrisoli]|uniref:Site-specific integrase n=1 Tax=Streptantibioticus rubrisoli TaxID=1387313 RepID=A0ABT1PGJ3_9ACTN|nr:tyrosine-type recombinase/integrase [Streptantibioticus rubrisoli]MCQ4044482.1 site-specific integrase [Streptantibioticus rubrisoli]
MSKRQPNGNAKIFLGYDGDYHGFITVGLKDDGSPDRRHRQGKTAGEVRDKLRELERKRDAGHVPGKGRVPTVEEWVTAYLDTIAPRTLAPRSLDDYRSKAKNWIIPGLGQHKLDRVQPEHLDRLYAKMLDAGKAPSHVLKVHRVLSRMLKIAVQRGIVARNVAQLVQPPTVREAEIIPFTREETRKILAAAQAQPSAVRWAVGLALGLRQGEALGLRWTYLDLNTGRVRVWWQLQRNTWRHGCDDPHACGAKRHKTRPCPKTCKQHKRKCPPPCPKDCVRHASTCPERKGGGLVFREPKGKSKRTISLPPELIPVLEAHRVAQQRQRALAGTAWEERDLVFCQPDGRPVDPRDDWEDWKGLLRAAGVRDARVHDGRHTSATLLLEYGVDVRIVMETLGHSDLRVTTRYTHIATPLAQEAARRMGQALWGNNTSPQPSTAEPIATAAHEGPTATGAATEKAQVSDANVVDLGFYRSRLRESNP